MNYDISNPALAEAGARRDRMGRAPHAGLGNCANGSPRRNRSMGSSSPPASMSG